MRNIFFISVVIALSCNTPTKQQEASQEPKKSNITFDLENLKNELAYHKDCFDTIRKETSMTWIGDTIVSTVTSYIEVRHKNHSKGVEMFEVDSNSAKP